MLQITHKYELETDFCSSYIMLIWLRKVKEMFSTSSSCAVKTRLPENCHQAIRFHLQVLNQLERLR